MTSTPCQSAALERIIAPWTAKIAVFLHTIVRTILHEFAACCRKAGQRLLALRPGLSWPMTPKLKTMGRHARLLRHRTGFLPPSAAPARITDNCKVALDVSLSAQMREARQVLLDRGREEQRGEANGDDERGESSWISEPEGHDT